MKRYLLTFLIIGCFASQSWGAKTRTANAFLAIGQGAGPVAMAESYTAIADGAFGPAYNPAGLAVIPGITLGLQHNEWFADMRMEYLSGVLPFGPGGLYGAINYMSYGSLEVRNEEGFATGESFQPFDLALTGGYGWEVFPSWMVGGTLTLSQGYIQDFNDTGFGADLGALWRSPWQGITFGGAFKHLGVNLSGYTWPMRFVLAASSKDLLTAGLLTDAEIDLPLTSGNVELALGAQYTLMRTIAFRVGYRATLGEGDGTLSGLTLGLGVEWNRFDIGYAMRPMGDFGLTHRISVSYAFPPMAVPLGQVEEKALYHYKQGQALEKKEDWLGALIEYRTALGLQPDWTEVDAALRRVDNKLKAAKAKQEKVREAIAAAAQPKAEDIQADRQIKEAIKKHFETGLRLLQKKQFTKSIREWELILEFEPEHKEARKMLEQTKKALNTERTLIHEKALAARKENDVAGEMQYWRQAVELDPEDQVAMENLWLGIMMNPATPEQKKEEKKKLKW